ncbi:MAG: DNA gyrase subunit A [Calditrichaeota bacterium]|nr:DNA gyrase subunit A [Calditrichota bacterium]MCB9369365.1 DNA gyrase subunit A [Calditrichota bacterium]
MSDKDNLELQLAGNGNGDSRIIPVNVEDEMKSSYINYSMSVIVSRALPDVRDGLKPVHRRILYGMLELGLGAGRSYKKCARIVGDVMGKYHPHGDQAIYDTLVRMVQDFSLRYPLVDGQGNFGSVDGDGAAAMRYTEARMNRIAEEMLAEIDKNTVDFVPNYDESIQIPSVMPAKFPNLLVNGSDGIAVGMATRIPPHNLTEVCDAAIAMIGNESLTAADLMQYVTAPDFPTGGIIFGKQGIRDAYLTGRGKIVVRAKASIEQPEKANQRTRIVVNEIPYQVNKTRLIERIVDLVNDKKIEGIADIRDESDRDGMRLVIELKREAVPEVVMASLFKHTPMQESFGVIMLALVHGVPRVLTLRDMISEFLEHRNEVTLRRVRFELQQALDRLHILEGLQIAVDHIDEVISIIRGSSSPEVAAMELRDRFGLSEKQSKAILDMRLARLTGLERQKLADEIREVKAKIAELEPLAKDENRALRLAVVQKELEEIKEKYGDKRRTEVVEDEAEVTIEDLIAPEEMVVTISHSGYVKRFPVSGFRKQGRGGRGSQGATTKEEDFVETLFIASTHDYILFFTDRGKCYWLKVYQIPQMGRGTRGKALVNLIERSAEEKVRAYVTVKEFAEDKYVLMCTKRGTVKKTALSDFSNPRSTGIIAINIADGDELLDAALTDGNNEVIIGTSEGKAVRFNESDVRAMGRTATGVRGVLLKPNAEAVGMIVVRGDSTILTVTEKGYGKRGDVSGYRLTKRGAGGVLALKTTDKTGPLVAMKEVGDSDDLIIITEQGVAIRQSVKDIRTMGRATQGVRLIRLDDGDKVGDVAKIVNEDDDSEIELDTSA